MAVVTALRLQSKNRQRVNVYLDGAYGLSVDRVLVTSVRPGQELTPVQLEDLSRRDAVETACRQALRLLSRRPRSERELHDAWQRRKVDPATQVLALARLRTSGQLDDRAFARAWVENRAAFQPKGVVALRMELRKKGVADEIIEESLQGIDEEAAAYAAAVKVSRRWKDLPWDGFRDRLGGYLRRRGFGYELTTSVVRRVWREGKSAGTEREVLS
jgi:regulatory protein